MGRRLRALAGVEVQGKRVLLRVDCNVAVDEDGRPYQGAEQRLRAALETLRDLRAAGARVIVLTHLGRPSGRVEEALRLDDIGRRLSVLLGHPVRYLSEIRGPAVSAAARALRDGEILLLENLRFDPGEEANDLNFARDLAALGELYVNDAFGVAHRAHASVAALPTLLPAYAGRILLREVTVLRGILDAPRRPAVAVVSGVKLETKLRLLHKLLPRVDVCLTGGGVANTLLKAGGAGIGASLVDEQDLAEARTLWSRFGRKLRVPRDVRVAPHGRGERAEVRDVRGVLPTDVIYDVGPETVAAYCGEVRAAATVLWNGPLGKFELAPFAESTRLLPACVRAAAFAVVGGGDTVRALTELNALDAFDHVSTGGGAMLALLEGAPMPGLEPLYES